jgi:hypothetical protein
MPEAKPKHSKKLYETKRNTFIDDINKPRNKWVPGVGKYNVTLTEDEIKKRTEKIRNHKIKVSEKDNFLCNF